jgi:hypothetical protein
MAGGRVSGGHSMSPFWEIHSEDRAEFERDLELELGNREEWVEAEKLDRMFRRETNGRGEEE